jgi:hypothetical protein
MTPEQFAYAQSERVAWIREAGERLSPHYSAMIGRLHEVKMALYFPDSRLSWILPAAEWADAPAGAMPVTFADLPVTFADVPAPMLAIDCRRD